MSIGNPQVLTTQGRGHTPEEWVDMLMPKLIGIADTAPEPLRQQATQFKHELRAMILWHMKEAIRSDRTTVANQLRASGHNTLADMIERV